MRVEALQVEVAGEEKARCEGGIGDGWFLPKVVAFPTKSFAWGRKYLYSGE